MFTVRVAARVRSEAASQFINQVRREEREVPEQFEGCERFSVWTDPDDPTSVLIYEEWRSAEDFERYRGSDYFAASGKILFPMINGAPDSAYYRAERVGP